MTPPRILVADDDPANLELLQVFMLRKRFLNHPIKILALTGDARPELREALRRDGANAYMIKPVRLAALHEEVQRLLAL